MSEDEKKKAVKEAERCWESVRGAARMIGLEKSKFCNEWLENVYGIKLEDVEPC